MNPIIEKVARALADSFKDRIAKAAAMPFSETGVATPNVFVWEEYARAAIRATLEHLKENVSDGMVAEAMLAIDTPFFADVEAVMKSGFSQAIAELDSPT